MVKSRRPDLGRCLRLLGVCAKRTGKSDKCIVVPLSVTPCTPAPATDTGLVEDDLFGRPSLGLLLSDKEKAEYKAIDFNNRANMVWPGGGCLCKVAHRRLS